MRRAWLLAVLALAADPALADVTARFRQADGPPIVIQANDRGDSRMAVTDGVYVTHGGVNHMILTFPGGAIVVRQEDFIAVMTELTSVVGPARPADRGRIAITEHGRETVGGRSGTVYRVGDEGSADRLEFVLSTDADLAPIGQVFRAQFLPMLTAQSSTPPSLAAAMTDLLSRGALLRFGSMFQLEAVDAAPVPPSTFELPSAPVSRDVLRERIMGMAAR